MLWVLVPLVLAGVIFLDWRENRRAVELGQLTIDEVRKATRYLAELQAELGSRLKPIQDDHREVQRHLAGISAAQAEANAALKLMPEAIGALRARFEQAFHEMEEHRLPEESKDLGGAFFSRIQRVREAALANEEASFKVFEQRAAEVPLEPIRVRGGD